MADTFLVIGTGPTVNLVLSGVGASAYTIWLEAGNTGTEQDFLDSLEGPQGPAGATGATGATGPQGPPGDDAPVQTLSIDGNDLTLSDGGGTVTIPGGASDALGTGFTDGGGSGTIPSATTLDGNGNDLTMNNFTSLILGSSYMSLTADEGYFAGGYFGFNADYWESNAQTVNFSISDGLGIRYAADNSATIAANPSSVPDVRAVNLLKQTPVSYTNAAAPNNTIFYSTTDSKLSYKDPGGTVHGLY